MARRLDLFRTAMRGALWGCAALVVAFFALVALYAFVGPGLDADARPPRRGQAATSGFRCGSRTCRPRRDRGGRRLRGRDLLRKRRRRLGRASRGSRRGWRQRPLARRLDADHADGEEPVSLARPVGRPQGPRDPDGARPRQALAEAAGDGDLPQRRRMGRRRLRDRGRGRARLPQERRRARTRARARCWRPRCPTRASAIPPVPGRCSAATPPRS